ncbi:hypothetical protein B0H14DRAFT_3628467 [Mycena olivaceomarginata]|nr:hypothetical protein B0H14DRAFT_3628467 [Mycena olivaceomarginata]
MSVEQTPYPFPSPLSPNHLTPTLPPLPSPLRTLYPTDLLIPPIQIVCYCTDCHQSSGSAFSTNFLAPKKLKDVTIKGPVKEYNIKAASGNTAQSLGIAKPPSQEECARRQNAAIPRLRCRPLLRTTHIFLELVFCGTASFLLTSVVLPLFGLQVCVWTVFRVTALCTLAVYALFEVFGGVLAREALLRATELSLDDDDDGVATCIRGR